MAATLLTATVLTLMTAVSLAVYLLPVLIGWARHVPDLGSVAVINLLLGWTLAGWVVALALALRSAHPDAPVVQLVQTFPPPLPPAAELPPAGWAGPPGPPPSRPDSPPPLILPPHPAGWWDPAGED